MRVYMILLLAIPLLLPADDPTKLRTAPPDSIKEFERVFLVGEKLDDPDHSGAHWRTRYGRYAAISNMVIAHAPTGEEVFYLFDAATGKRKEYMGSEDMSVGSLCGEQLRVPGVCLRCHSDGRNRKPWKLDR